MQGRYGNSTTLTHAQFLGDGLGLHRSLLCVKIPVDSGSTLLFVLYRRSTNLRQMQTCANHR